MAYSSIRDFAEDTSYMQIIVDKYGKNSHPSTVYFCAGRIILDLHQIFEELDPNAHVVRVEEMAPFPMDSIREYLGTISGKTNVVWI